MIDIIDGWSFNIDEHQYVLVHTYIKERINFKTRKGTGEMVEKSEEVGYFTTVEAMLRRLAEILVRDKVGEGQIETIKDYVAELDRINKRLHEACRGY